MTVYFIKATLLDGVAYKSGQVKEVDNATFERLEKLKLVKEYEPEVDGVDETTLDKKLIEELKAEIEKLKKQLVIANKKQKVTKEK